ncbi:PREDICTED: polygalacturonase-like [Nelumbo nucifera]|uniref:Polygalacturonase-like n=2 Tax=Nelumbo nucifera TaxID=4432 RepID=A0A822ZY18_NELNU|nr:PREDICTED: polygalacturonase-like [Nelumbo nucifera]DAD47736.1 TPA_asm: hypothetical protein HUJ06_017673 [Nelumbo nucifera]
MARVMNSLMSSVFFIPLLLTSIDADINVADFGAKADGKTDASEAFLAAWAAACSSTKPTTIYLPAKKYFLGPVVFRGPCNNSRITLQMDAILVAPDYQEMASSENWIMFDVVDGLSVIGGYLDGRGSSFWKCKGVSNNCSAGSTSLAIYSSKNIVVQNLTSINSKLGHILVHTCRDVVLQGVRIRAPDQSPHTDGIHVQNSINVSILNAGIKTGDDCISIGQGTTNLWIERVACGPGHGISIGSLAKDLEEEGVENVVVQSVVFTGTQNGVRIKSWGRPSNGYVKGVVFKKVLMKNVNNPIVIDQNYCPRNENCPYQDSGVEVNGVSYIDIEGTSATQVALNFDCSPTSPCKEISLQDINLTYQNKPAQSSCQNAFGVARGQIVPPSCLLK